MSTALLLAVSAALAADPACLSESAGGASTDLYKVLSFADLELARPLDFSALSDAALAQKAAEVERRAQAVERQALAYAALMDRVAGYSFATLTLMADHEAWTSPHQQWPGNPLVRNQPQEWIRIPVDRLVVLRTAAGELTHQLREDLRDGRVSAPLNPADLALETTAEGAAAALRLNQALYRAGVPVDLAGHSPVSVEDVRGLQALAEGALPDARTQPAAASSLLYALSDELNPDRALKDALREGRAPEGTRGLPRTLRGAPEALEALDTLARERAALDKALAERGLPASGAPTLDRLEDRLQALDEDITRFGTALEQRLLGLTLPPHLLEAPVIGPGSQEVEWQDVGDGRLVTRLGRFDRRYSPWTDAQLDEGVQLKDSLQLLRGNRSGLDVTDLSMDEWTRYRLGLRDTLPPLERADAPRLQTILPEWTLVRMERGEPRIDPIDEAALVSADRRYEYLRALNSRALRRSLSERSRTQITAELDNTWLNRTVEVLNVPGWAFKSTPDDWIGPRAERNLERSRYIGREVDGLREQVSEDAIFGRYLPAMQGLREIRGLNDTHEGYNDRYEVQHEQTEFETILFLGTLPLSAMGAADDAVALLRGAGARLSAARATASLADDALRLVDDGARLADDALRVADDALRLSDDGMRLADDALRLADDAPDAALLERIGEPSGTFTHRASEVPYANPPRIIRANPSRPTSLQALDTGEDYLWVVDADGDLLIAPELQGPTGYAPGRKVPGIVKHGDLTPGPDGATRGIARAGGELKWDPAAGKWTLNNASSYSFNRTDEVLGTLDNLEAVRELMGRSGIDPSMIQLKDVITPR